MGGGDGGNVIKHAQQNMKNYIRKITLISRLGWTTCGQRLLQLLKLKGRRKYCSYIEEREIFFFFFFTWFGQTVYVHKRSS